MIQGVPALTQVKRDVPCSVKSGKVLDDPGCASFNTSGTRCSVFQKCRGSVKSGQVLDDPGCATFNTGVTMCSVFQKNKGCSEISAGTG